MRPAKSEKLEKPEKHDKRKSVLIVEDDSAMRLILYDHLSEKYETKMTSTCKEAINLFAENDFDLVVLDFHLPDGNGLDLIQNFSLESKTPILIMTAHPQVEFAVSAMKAGAYDYIVKPFEFHEFDNLVKKALSEERQREKILKRQVTLRLDDAVIEYFKKMASETGVTYQNLINIYLRGCVKNKEQLQFHWDKV